MGAGRLTSHVLKRREDKELHDSPVGGRPCTPAVLAWTTAHATSDTSQTFCQHLPFTDACPLQKVSPV
jgi:hypothetical protein